VKDVILIRKGITDPEVLIPGKISVMFIFEERKLKS